MIKRRQAGNLLRCMLLVPGIMLFSGCMTNPSIPSPGVPGAPPSPEGTGSPSPSPGASTAPKQGTHTPASTDGTGSSSSRTAGRTGDPAAGGDADARAGDPAAGGNADTRAGDPAVSNSADARQKSDDEILAEALEALEQRSGSSDDTAAQGGAEPQGTGLGPATEQEKTQQLDQALDQKFASFDEAMLREREAVLASDNEQGNRGFSDRESYGSAGEGEGEADEELQTAMADTRPSEPGTTSRQVPGDPTQASQRAIPEDIASGEDDDIIARQLREAAMKEQDPELREKLWDEYRKYKRSQ